LDKTKPFDISKHVVWEAYLRVKANQGAAGIDEQSIADFERELKNNLYKIWNRMSSGSYFPPPVRTVSIPKSSGGLRKLGIPIVRSHCTSIQWTWGLLGDTDRVMTAITLSQFDYRGAEVTRDRRRRAGLRSSAMISGVSLIHRGLVSVARMLSKRPALHQSAIVETSTFRMLAAALAE
jgi:hypothetical protein